MRWLSLFLLALILAACGERPLPPVAESRKLVVLMRESPATLTYDENKKPAGFEYDLVALFAEELGKKLRLVVVKSDAEITERLKAGRGHLGAAWLSTPNDAELSASPSFYKSADTIVQNGDALAVDAIDDLLGHAVHVIAGSRQAAAAQQMKRQMPDLQVIEHAQTSELELLERVSTERDTAALIDRAVLDIASNYYPMLQYDLSVNDEAPIVWQFRAGADPELQERVEAFIERIRADGTLARLRDRYFGHVDRLKQIDVVHFIEQIGTVLPRHRQDFQSAQASTGIDWRLLAALAYQESHWDPLATSPTGVRGMMMLTEDTADHLRVSNRLDARQSIRAGARYLADLRDALPPSVAEPDRTWMALAAYNLGMGHLNGARHIAQGLKKDADSWYEMKTVLPLLARPQYYQRLKSGKGRGGEAVIMTENIRMYYDILCRFEPPYQPYAERKVAAATGSARR